MHELTDFATRKVLKTYLERFDLCNFWESLMFLKQFFRLLGR